MELQGAELSRIQLSYCILSGYNSCHRKHCEIGLLSHNCKHFVHLPMFFILYPFYKFLKTDIWPWLKQASLFICYDRFFFDWCKYFHTQINFFHILKRWRTVDLSGKQENGTRSLQKFWQKLRLCSYSKCLKMPLFSNTWDNSLSIMFLFCEAGKCVSKITADILDRVFNLSSGIQSSVRDKHILPLWVLFDFVLVRGSPHDSSYLILYCGHLMKNMKM